MSILERRYFNLDSIEVDEERDGKEPVLRGHAAVFNSLSEDLGGFREMIAPGAFASAIQEDDVRALFNHDSNIVLGRNRAKPTPTLELREDATGLAVAIKMPPTQAARDLAISIKRGDVSQMSFGFSVRDKGSTWAKVGDQVVRTLTSVRLFDVSPVTFPAYPQTDVAARSYKDWLEGVADEERKRANVDIAIKELELLELM